MGKILSILAMVLAMAAGAHRISSVETSGGWVYTWNNDGKKIGTRVAR